MAKLKCYDNTRLDAGRTCLRYFLLRHVYSWRLDTTAAPLVFGGAWGAAMDVVWNNYSELYDSKEDKATVIEAAYEAFNTKWTTEGFKHPDSLTIDDIDDLGARTPTNALEMIGNYIDARENLFTDPSFELISIEEPFIVPLNPDDPTLFYVGRMDKVFRYRKSVYGLDHKSTTVYNGSMKAKSITFEGNWTDGWGMNDQIDGYSFAGHQKFGKEFGGIWIDGALVHKTEHRTFKIVPIDKQLPQLDAWLWDTMTWVELIEANKAVLEERTEADTPYLAAFPRNRKSCIQYRSKCPYFDVCRMIPNPAKLKEPPLGFKVEVWDPIKELKLEAVLKENVEP